MLRDNQREGKKDQERKDGRMARKEAQGAERAPSGAAGCHGTTKPKARKKGWNNGKTGRLGHRAGTERETSGNRAGVERRCRVPQDNQREGQKDGMERWKDRKLRAPSGNRAAPSGRGAALRAPSGRRAALQCATGQRKRRPGRRTEEWLRAPSGR